MKPIEVVLLGAGNRGFFAYGNYALKHPGKLKIVAFAEPDAGKRDRFARAHGIPEDRCFAEWKQLLDRPKPADYLINATMDQEHLESTVAAFQRGYHVLLEKPMATDPLSCLKIVKAAEAYGRKLNISHVLRYTPFFQTIKAVVDSGSLGRILSVEHKENVAFYHYAHGFVRGSWRSEHASSPMLLAKCSHDLDILVWLLGEQVKKVSSFGSLSYFNRQSMPPGAAARCTDGCPAEETCAYSTLKHYLGKELTWLNDGISLDASYEGRLKALQESDIGRCVFQCDNDVVDHQVVNMEFANGATVSFTMSVAAEVNRKTTIFGTDGELYGDLEHNRITVKRYVHSSLTRSSAEEIELLNIRGGHNGGDPGLLDSFVRDAHHHEEDGSMITSARQSLLSHLLAFAAERSRKEGKVVHMDDYIASLERQAE